MRETLRDVGLTAGFGRSPGGGHGNLLRCSCLENPRHRAAWRGRVHRVTKSQTQLKQFRMHTRTYTGGTSGKEPACQYRRCERCGFNPWVGKIPWRRAWQPTPVFLPGESHAQRSLVGYSPWGQTQVSDSTTSMSIAAHTSSSGGRGPRRLFPH